jgi:hypothetical protein
LPESEYSYVLQDWAQALGGNMRSPDGGGLRMILGLNLPVDSWNG